MYNIDLHLHTGFSPDGSIGEEDIRKVISSGILDAIAITDHDTIEGAQHYQSIFGPERVIVGEEITTRDGEIIGLYLEERIQPGMSAAETVNEIRRQDGVVYIPHPFETKRKGITQVILDQLDYDIIEVINGRAIFKKPRQQAQQVADIHRKPKAASSDAHGPIGWGNVYTQISAMPTRENLVELLGSAGLRGDRNGYFAFLYPKINRRRGNRGV